MAVAVAFTLAVAPEDCSSGDGHAADTTPPVSSGTRIQVIPPAARANAAANVTAVITTAGKLRGCIVCGTSLAASRARTEVGLTLLWQNPRRKFEFFLNLTTR